LGFKAAPHSSHHLKTGYQFSIAADKPRRGQGRHHDYIAGFYNCTRINSALGNLPPAVYERKMASRKPIVVSEFT
jgi:transposase InsO family protein